MGPSLDNEFKLEEWRVRQGDCAILHGPRAQWDSDEDDTDVDTDDSSHPPSRRPNASNSNNNHAPSSSSRTQGRGTKRVRDEIDAARDDEYLVPQAKRALVLGRTTIAAFSKTYQHVISSVNLLHINPGVPQLTAAFITHHIGNNPRNAQSNRLPTQPQIFGLHHACIYAFNICFGIQRPGHASILLQNLP